MLEQRINEKDLDGYCFHSHTAREIGVNIEKLQKNALTRCKKNPEPRFIKEFANTYNHELIHWLIGKVIGASLNNRTPRGEEKTI